MRPEVIIVERKKTRNREIVTDGSAADCAGCAAIGQNGAAHGAGGGADRRVSILTGHVGTSAHAAYQGQRHGISGELGYLAHHWTFLNKGKMNAAYFRRMSFLTETTPLTLRAISTARCMAVSELTKPLN